MSRIVSRAESFEKVYDAFQTVNFSAFDFNTIKESLLEYIKLYFPEEFNDYIESSEFIAVLEMFAYISEQFAYRLDINAHENFLSTAQRKESILRLAKLISYGPSRNIPNRGLVKISSIQTTETVFDSIGRNLAGRQIIWNDANNPDWKEQFFLVMNRVLQQPFGSVTPDDRVQVDDVLFELYSWNNNPLSTAGPQVFGYTANVGGQGYPMELVPVALTSDGPQEKRPERSGPFTILFGNDGLGDASDTTGFFVFTKQGTLQKQTTSFDGVTPNQTFDIAVDNINETDIFVNNIDPSTGDVLEDDGVLFSTGDSGLWVEVDIANAQNIIFNTNSDRRKFEIEPLDDDQVRFVFGDGEFAEIPSGTFDLWYRISANENLSIPQNTVIDQNTSFTYTDAFGGVQTLSYNFSLISSLQNGTASEDIEHIRAVAPSVYYTQDRMVNARDYNSFMLQDPSIVKLLAVNRTFAGDSKYIPWHDPSQSYESVKIFGDDLALYYQERSPADGALTVVGSPIDGNTLLNNFIEPYLSSTDFFLVIAPQLEALNIDPGSVRRNFNNDPLTFASALGESDTIIAAIDFPGVSVVELYYTVLYDEWTVNVHPYQGSTCTPSPSVDCGAYTAPAGSQHIVRIEANYTGSNLSGWDVRFSTKRLICQSEETQFWNTNTASQIVDFDTLNPNLDNLVVLQANVNANETGVLDADKNFSVIGQELVEQNLPNAGLPDIHRLSILPEDLNEDGIADNLTLPVVFNKIEEFGSAALPTLTLTRTHVVDRIERDSLRVYHVDQSGPVEVSTEIPQFIASDPGGNVAPLAESWEDVTVPGSVLTTDITIGGSITVGASEIIRVEEIDYVYFTRDSSQDPWQPIRTTDQIKTLFALNYAAINLSGIEDDRRYKREAGRFPLNFAWFHFTPRLNLVDPAASNIIDMFLITQGYLSDTNRYLNEQTNIEPAVPSSLALRTAYSELLENRMISDTVVLHAGTFKVLFGPKAPPELRAKFKVIRPQNQTLTLSLTDNEVKVRIVEIIQSFLDVITWEFGETFYFTELVAAIHRDLGTEIDSVVIVPLFEQTQFGDLFEIPSREDEVLIPDINTSDVEIVLSYTPENTRQQE